MQVRDYKKIGRGLFISVWVLFSALVLIGFFTITPNRTMSSELSDLRELKPIFKMEEEDGTWVYSLNVNDEAQKGDSIMFYTNHQSVHVYNLNEECYSLLPQDSIWSHSTGSTWNMFKIPNGAGLLRVEVKRVYEEMGNVEVSFYAGEPTALTQNVVKDSIVGVIVSLVIVICGLILFFYWVYAGENRDKIMGVFYFSFFCITLGLWSLGETQAAMILVSNRPMASYVGYIFIYFLCVPFVMFVRYFLHSHERVLYKIYFALWLAALVVCNALQFANIRDLKQTSFVLHTILGLGLTYCLYLLLVCFMQKKHRRECFLCFVGLLCLAVTYLVDLVWFYKASVETNQIGKFGFLLFVLILGVEIIRHGQQNVKEARLTNFYKELAMKDMLSGCFNRNAFDREVEKLDQEDTGSRKNITLFTFDLNNLKKCNDTLGHMVGDQYVKDAAELLRGVFRTKDKIYRIGGDEFCVILKNVPKERAAELCEDIRSHEFVYEKDQKVSCRMAAGFAAFDTDADESLENTRERADALMYQNKKEMKENS